MHIVEAHHEAIHACVATMSFGVVFESQMRGSILKQRNKLDVKFRNMSIIFDWL